VYVESRGAHGHHAVGSFEARVGSRREVWIGSDCSGLIRETSGPVSFFTADGEAPIPGPPCSPPGGGRGTVIERGFLLGTGYFEELEPQLEEWLAHGVVADAQYHALKDRDLPDSQKLPRGRYAGSRAATSAGVSVSIREASIHWLPKGSPRRPPRSP